jgi:hypothetical protein
VQIFIERGINLKEEKKSGANYSAEDHKNYDYKSCVAVVNLLKALGFNAWINNLEDIYAVDIKFINEQSNVQYTADSTVCKSWINKEYPFKHLECPERKKKFIDAMQPYPDRFIHVICDEQITRCFFINGETILKYSPPVSKDTSRQENELFYQVPFISGNYDLYIFNQLKLFKC